MGLILCENNKAKQPFFFKSLGIQLYSLEELCYVIYNNPLFVIHDFVNERLFSFLKYDLNIGLNALMLERRSKDSAYDGDVLISILNFSDYYSTQEIEKYKLIINELNNLPGYDLYDRIGMAYFANCAYGKALDYFNDSIKNTLNLKLENDVILKITEHKADALANLFCYHSAFTLYKSIFEANNDDNLLKKIYYLSKFDDVISHKEEYINFLDDRVNDKWDIEYQTLKEKASQSDESKDFLTSIHVDSYKKKILLNEKINDIKTKYRNMI